MNWELFKKFSVSNGGQTNIPLLTCNQCVWSKWMPEKSGLEEYVISATTHAEKVHPEWVR